MKKQFSGIAVYIVIVLIVFMGYRYFFNQIGLEDQFSYEQLVSALDQEKVESVEIQPNGNNDTGQVSVEFTGGDEKQFYVLDVKEIQDVCQEYGVDPLVRDIPADNTFLTTVLPMILVVLLVVFMFSMMTRQMSGGSNSKMMNFGKSRACLLYT